MQNKQYENNDLILNNLNLMNSPKSKKNKFNFNEKKLKNDRNEIKISNEEILRTQACFDNLNYYFNRNYKKIKIKQ